MRPVRAVLGGLFLVLPVAFWPGSTSFDALKFTLAGVAVGLGLIGLGLYRRPLPRVSHWLMGAGPLVLVVMLFGLIVAGSPALVLRTCWLFGLWWALALLTAMTVGEGTGRRYLAAAITGIVLACLYGWTQLAGWLPGAPLSSGFPVAISTLGNQNYLAGLAAVAFFPSLILWQGRRRVLAMAGTAVLGVTVLVGGAAGPQAAVVATGLILLPALLLSRRDARYGPTVLVTLILAGIFAAGLLTATVLRSAPGESLAGEVRRTDYYVAFAMFRESPLIGVGAGNHQAEWTDTRARLERESPHLGLVSFGRVATRAHHEYLQVAAETGMIGVVVGLILASWGAWAWWRRWQTIEDDGDRHDRLLLAGALLVAGIHALVSFPFHLPVTGLVLALAVGWSWSGDGSAANRLSRPGGLAAAGAGMAIAVFAVWLFAADLTLARGTRAFVSGRLDTARADLESGVSRSPWPGTGLTFLGMTQIATGDPNEGILHLEAGDRQAPGHEGRLALAEAFIDAGQFHRAEAILETVMDARPLIGIRFQARYLQGLILLRQRMFDGAEAVFQALVADDPTSYRALLALGYLEVLRNRPAEARELYRRAERIILDGLAQKKTPANLEEAGERLRLQRNLAVARKAIVSTGQR